ncbi:hypothetical protein [Komagataeibacter melomenusus]|nr:hypothetical protein [Komagataeibacter melomenusus]
MREEIQTFLRQLAAFRLLLVLGTGQRGIVWHGRLRATAASWLAEMGCTEHEIMSITGHTTTASVSVYVRYAEQKTRAVNAIAKLSNRPLEQAGRKQGVTNIFKQGKKVTNSDCGGAVKTSVKSLKINPNVMVAMDGFEPPIKGL